MVPLEKVDRRSENECWNWLGYSPNGRYGAIYLNNKRILAHRVVWEECKGSVPEGLCVCHTCDNPKCCNPSHLFLGTHKENMEDRNKKGRASNGGAQMRKLTDKQALEILVKRKGGISAEFLALEYRISTSLVKKIGLSHYSHVSV